MNLSLLNFEQTFLSGLQPVPTERIVEELRRGQQITELMGAIGTGEEESIMGSLLLDMKKHYEEETKNPDIHAVEPDEFVRRCRKWAAETLDRGEHDLLFVDRLAAALVTHSAQLYSSPCGGGSCKGLHLFVTTLVPSSWVHGSDDVAEALLDTIGEEHQTVIATLDVEEILVMGCRYAQDYVTEMEDIGSRYPTQRYDCYSVCGAQVDALDGKYETTFTFHHELHRQWVNLTRLLWWNDGGTWKPR